MEKKTSSTSVKKETKKKNGKKTYTKIQCTQRRPQEPTEKDKDLLNNYLVFIIFFYCIEMDAMGAEDEQNGVAEWVVDVFDG